MSIIKNVSKLFKPNAPKSVEQAMAEGASIAPRFADENLDANGRPVDQSQRARDRAATVLVRIKQAKATIAAADGLPPIEQLRTAKRKAQFILDAAHDAWSKEQRKTLDAKYPPLLAAVAAYNTARGPLFEANERLQRAELAERAKSELPALIAERDA